MCQACPIAFEARVRGKLQASVPALRLVVFRVKATSLLFAVRGCSISKLRPDSRGNTGFSTHGPRIETGLTREPFRAEIALYFGGDFLNSRMLRARRRAPD